MESMMSYAPELMITAGIALLAIEVMILGFSTFILFFLGLSLLISGVLAWLGILPLTWAALFLANAIFTGVLAAALWQPMLKIQNKTDDKKVKSDFDGYRFYLDEGVGPQTNVTHQYSGIQWELKSHQPIAAGEQVEVVKAEVGVLWVAVVDSAKG